MLFRSDAPALREALARSCGLLGRVRKERLLLRVNEGGFNTRIHIDRVENLGDFMELEVVLQPGQRDAGGAAEAERLMNALGLHDAQRLAGSYFDLLQR